MPAASRHRGHGVYKYSGLSDRMDRILYPAGVQGWGEKKP